jgi:hypothetical protein
VDSLLQSKVPVSDGSGRLGVGTAGLIYHPRSRIGGKMISQAWENPEKKSPDKSNPSQQNPKKN